MGLERLPCVSNRGGVGVIHANPLALARPLTKQYDFHGADQNHSIEHETKVFNVVQVILEFFHRIIFSTAVVVADLRPAGEAGLAGEARVGRLGEGVAAVVGDQQRRQLARMPPRD